METRRVWVVKGLVSTDENAVPLLFLITSVLSEYSAVRLQCTLVWLKMILALPL